MSRFITLFILIFVSGLIFNNKVYSQNIPFSPLLVSFSPSECDESSFSFQKYNRIKSIEVSDTTTTIEVEIVGNCCVDFDATIEVKDTIINLIYMEAGDPCRCLCCYQFVYSISGITKEDDIVYLLNGRGVQGSK